MNIKELKQTIRVIENFPKPGINYLDITSLLENPMAFSAVVEKMAEKIQVDDCDKIAAIEARGFIPAAALAVKLQLPLVLLRKKGKLPGEVVSIAYELEYGSDILEMHKHTILPSEKIAVVDDILATGGTVKAACELIEAQGAIIGSVNGMLGLDFLSFRRVLEKYKINTVIDYKNL
jgi:adenine phosphoribosyltransferase